MAARTEADAQVGLRLRVQGVVQGVGFRPFVLRAARRLCVAGSVWNDERGVVLDAFGAPQTLEALRRELVSGSPAAANVERVELLQTLSGPAPLGFEIAESRGSVRDIPSLAPDVAVCQDCLEEVHDPASRRHGYAFTTCTRCGPRYSVAVGLPYDRERTTMQRFESCPECSREHDDPDDRRLHAQSLACPACGPRLSYLGGNRPQSNHAGDQRAQRADDAAIAAALALLRRGGILALQGIGGFHLACDARRADAVARLRKRKRRERKPLAVMVSSIAVAETLAELSDLERDLLDSPEAPIVLTGLRRDHVIADNVAPGLTRVGLMLAYSPLHRLLLDDFGGPLVMTSGNRTGEPLVWREADALEQLAEIADGFLSHDREIAAPCDDSIAQVVAGAPQLLRRSRGFVPRPIRLRNPVPEPILAVGGQHQSCIAVAVGSQAVLGVHGGDLDSPESVAAFEEGVGRLERLLGVRPRVVAHDRHPDYASTRYALSRGGAALGVQHHHAHLSSVLEDCGHAGAVLGLSWDGTGWGPDGHAWGGELLLGDASGFERLGTLRPIRLAGGARAIRGVWRQGLAILEDAFEGAPPARALGLLEPVGRDRIEAVRELLRKDVACVQAHGAGRWFDAMGALMLGCREASWSGEVATRWGFTARGPAEPYDFEITHDAAAAPLELDLRPMVRAGVADRLAGVAAERIAARFHATLAEGAFALIERTGAPHSALPVALSGGCFQNPLLTSLICNRLGSTRVLRHRRVPPGDGGLALGQIAVASARLSKQEE